MKKYFLFCISIFTLSTQSEAQDFITLEIVDVLNQNVREAKFYYKNNWEVLRTKAKKNDMIVNYTWYMSADKNKVYLITDFGTLTKWRNREINFNQIIKNHQLRLLNAKKPPEFRKQSSIIINKM